MLAYLLSAVVASAAGASAAAWITTSKLKTTEVKIEWVSSNLEAMDRLLEQHSHEIDLSYREMLEEFARVSKEIKALDSSAARKTGAMLQPVAKALAEVRETVGLS